MASSQPITWLANAWDPEALAELRQQGLIRHLGVSTVSLDQLAEAQRIAPVACVQNFYNIANRGDEAVLAATAEQGIAYVPYFPLGGFSPRPVSGSRGVEADLTGADSYLEGAHGCT